MTTKPKKPTKPRRKAHVAWVITAPHGPAVKHPYMTVFKCRDGARAHAARMRSLGWDGIRGPVKVVLP